MQKSESPYRVIKTRKLYEEVVEQIIELIRQKHLQPGDKLPPEREFAQELGVSRTALREAIKALEDRELIEVKHGSGMFVRSPSIETIERSFSLILLTDQIRYIELMDVRELLEVEIAGRLAESAAIEDLDKMQEKIDLMWQYLDAPDEFVKLDVEFHVAFYQAMHNDLLLTMMQPITEMLLEAVGLTFSIPGSAERSLRQHQKLVERIRAGDVDGAREVMRQIISRGRDRLEEGLRMQNALIEK